MFPLLIPSLCTLMFIWAGILIIRNGLPLTGLMICIGTVVSTGSMWLPFIIDVSWGPEGMPLWLQINFIVGNVFSILFAVGILRLAISAVNNSKHPGTQQSCAGV